MSAELPLKPIVREERREDEEKHYRLIGQKMLYKNQKLFSWNPDTQELKEVPIQRDAEMTEKGDVKTRGKVASSPNTIYVAAYHLKQAEIKVIKMYKRLEKQYNAKVQSAKEKGEWLMKNPDKIK